MDTGIDDHLGIKLIMNFDVRLRRNHPFDVYTCHLSNVIYGYRDRNWAVRVDERFGGPRRAAPGRAVVWYGRRVSTSRRRRRS